MCKIHFEYQLLVECSYPLHQFLVVYYRLSSTSPLICLLFYTLCTARFYFLYIFRFLPNKWFYWESLFAISHLLLCWGLRFTKQNIWMRLGGPQWKYNERHEQRVEEEWNCLAHIAFFFFLISLSAAFAKQIHLVHRGSLMLQIRLFQTNCVCKWGVSQDVGDACQVWTMNFFVSFFFFFFFTRARS